MPPLLTPVINSLNPNPIYYLIRREKTDIYTPNTKHQALSVLKQAAAAHTVLQMWVLAYRQIQGKSEQTAYH